jgi:hypothetical protein
MRQFYNPFPRSCRGGPDNTATFHPGIDSGLLKIAYALRRRIFPWPCPTDRRLSQIANRLASGGV